MLLEVAENHRDTSSLPEPAVSLTSQAEELIRSRFHLEISTAVLAEELGCCPDHLGRVFKAVTGATVTEAIHHCRINKASQLLIETTLGVDQIGYQVGFNDRAYFRRVFKRLRQTTPSAYRSLHSRATING
jgi:AraC-like DNA-binding protein